MTSLDPMASSNVTNKEDAGISTDAEENQQSEGESQKKSSSGGSPLLQRKSKIVKDDAPKFSSIPQPTGIHRRYHSTSASYTRPSDNNQNESSRLAVFNPPNMHVLQPHSHRRHFSHHLRDHFSSPQVLRSLESRKNASHKEIVPTLDSCDYKDTNFLTEGSPPRTPTHRAHLKSKQLSGVTVEESSSLRHQKRKKPTKLLPASLWREAAEKISPMQWRSSPDSDGSSDHSSKAANYLQKYMNESVSGPTRPIKDSRYAYSPNGTCEGKTEQNTDRSRAYNKPWRARGKAEVHKPRNLQNTPRNTSVRESETKKGLRGGSFGCTSSTSSMTSLRSGTRSKSKIYPCQTCLKRQRYTKTTGTQTESPDESLESSFGSKEDLVDDVIKKTLAAPDMTLYVMPQGLDSSESTSYSTEDTSSMTFDDDDVIIDGVSAIQTECGVRESKSDILFGMDEIQTKLQQIREDTRSKVAEDPQDQEKVVRSIFTELYEVATEVSELYDRFDSEEKDEHSEFNELKKQIRQYKRACRVLEYELNRANTKSNEVARADEVEEEVAISQQISTALYWELQNVDAKLRKVDQMSLHASSVPANDNALLKSHDKVSELHRQIQFQEEEKKAVLEKLIDTDKEKELLEEKLRLYFHHYGAISSPDEMVGKDQEWIDNDLKARIRAAEEQCGILSRRIMELRAENEKLAKLKHVSSSANPETPPRMSLSDIQFLEDEVETLRIFLDEVENENNSLRSELKQFQEKSSSNEKRFLLYQATQTSLRGMVTPTTSDKIAAWDAADLGTPITNRTETDFTVSVSENLPSFTVIDACTQTYFDLPRSASAKSFDSDRSLSVTERSLSFNLTKELTEVLNCPKETSVDNLVSQLANLALATRHLVDESPTSLRSTGDLHSSMMVEVEAQNVSCGPSTPLERVDTLRKESPTNSQQKLGPCFEKFHLLVATMMAHLIVTSLTITSSIKFAILVIIFLLI